MRTAMLNTTIPNPPIHCIQAREKRKVGELPSRVSTVLRPVVVMAEMASKRASVNSIPEPIIGQVMANGEKRKMREEITIASLLCMRPEARNLESPTPREAIMEITITYRILAS
jgi:hypothetical protein